MEVGAVEDLMREHGVIRRAILAYRHSAAKLRTGAEVDLAALQRAAKLLRSFGEDYHERELEERYIFPAIRRAGAPAAAYVDVLLDQHRRGREITDRILSAATGSDSETLATLLDGFELMYEHHATREDTVVFPAWKKTMSEHDLAEMGETFEDIEHKTFGVDGFDEAVAQITEIEVALGVDDIAQFTAS